jgi:hypothetical protein
MSDLPLRGSTGRRGLGCRDKGDAAVKAIAPAGRISNPFDEPAAAATPTKNQCLPPLAVLMASARRRENLPEPNDSVQAPRRPVPDNSALDSCFGTSLVGMLEAEANRSERTRGFHRARRRWRFSRFTKASCRRLPQWAAQTDRTVSISSVKQRSSAT